MSGIYYYLLSGDLLSGTQVYPYVELGKLAADGQGGISGNSHASVGGSISAYTLAGTYSMQASCTGSMTLSVNSQPAGSLTFQMVNGGQGAILAFSSSSGVVAGRAYRQTAGAGSIQCSMASLSGSYAYLLTGAAFLSGNGYYYSQAGSATGDGRGNMNATGMANVSGSTVTSTGQGPYSVAGDCSGTASVKNQNGTANYFIAVVEDGQAVLFMESDAGYAVGGVAQPLFVTPPSAVVNAASFDSQALAQGAIFSIFGRSLPQSSASAQVLVNGEAAPVFFANGSQINAQIPYDVPTDRPVSLSLSNAGTSSNAILLSIRQAAPGIFTANASGKGQGAILNQDYSYNGASNPAAAGSVVILYLTGAGAMIPATADGSVNPDPAALSQTALPVTAQIGGLPATVLYAGSSEGIVSGVIQVNLVAPNGLAGLSQPITIKVGEAATQAGVTVAIH